MIASEKCVRKGVRKVDAFRTGLDGDRRPLLFEGDRLVIAVDGPAPTENHKCFLTLQRPLTEEPP